MAESKEQLGYALRLHLREMKAATDAAQERNQALADSLERRKERAAKSSAKRTGKAIHEAADEAPDGTYAEAVAEQRVEMFEQGATEAEIQSAEHSGALVAGGSDEDGDPAPTPGSDAAKQTGDLDRDEEAVPEDERDSEADEQRAVIDLQAPDDDKREAAQDAHAADDDRRTVKELRDAAKGAGVTGYSDMKRADLLAALARDES